MVRPMTREERQEWIWWAAVMALFVVLAFVPFIAEWLSR